MTAIFRLTALIALAALGGCTWFEENRDPTPVTVDLQAGANVNPDNYDEAAPVVVRVYLLQKKDTFTGSEFNAIYLHDKQTLAGDMVSSQEYELAPGKATTFTTPDAQAATIVGVLAAYRNIEHAQWRAVMDLKPHRENALVAQLNPAAVSLADKNKPGWLARMFTGMFGWL